MLGYEKRGSINIFFDVHEYVFLRSEIIRFIFSIAFYEVYVVKIYQLNIFEFKINSF